MNSRISRTLGLLSLLAAGIFGYVLPAQAQVVLELTGSHGNSEGSCTQISKLFGTFDCTYGGVNNTGTAGGWSGPTLGGTYYAAGSVGDSTAYAPVVGDAKISPAITGQLTITGTGAAATVAGTIVVGAGVRNVSTGQATRAVQRWTSITHTLPTTTVSAATANGSGGFDYVVGSRGVPEQICLAPGGACFGVHETGAQTTTGPVNTWGVGGVAGTKPTVGITRLANFAGAAATGTTDQTNVGATTTAVIAGDSCDSTGATDCASGTTLWGRGEDPGWDNLIMAFSTNAAGNITSGRAYWTQDYTIALGGGSGDNSDSSGTFTFTGSVSPVCADFAVTVDEDSSNNDIAALAQCTNFGAAVTISIVTPPTNGTATVSGTNSIVYTPNAGFDGTDTLTYNGDDGTDNDDGVLTITVATDLVPVVADGNIVTDQDEASAPLALTITAGNGTAAEHTLAVTTDGTNGSCTLTAADATGQVIYTPDAGFFGTDSCVVTLTDSNGDSDTATINVVVNETDGIIVIDGGSSAVDPASLAVLGGLLPFLRRRRKGAAMKVAMAATAGVLAAPAAMAAPGDWDWDYDGLYIGAGVIGTSLETSDSFNSSLADELGVETRGSFEDFPYGGQLYLGWMFNRYWGIEGRYSDSGDGESDILLQEGGDTTNIGDIEASIDGWTAYLVGNWPMAPQFDLFAKVGYTDQSADLDVTLSDGGEGGGGGSFSGSEDDDGFAGALGARWRFARHWAATVEGEYLGVDFDSTLDEPWRVGLNVEYWFGGNETAAPAVAPVAAAVAAPPPPPPPPAPRPVPVPLDGDGDGVVDGSDKCPETPRGDRVGAQGCSCDVSRMLSFKFDSAELSDSDKAILDEMAENLTRLQFISGTIEGYTDSVGPEAYNLSLSERRARSAANYLESKGVAAGRLEVIGRGEADPVGDNSTDEGRAQNRRVVAKRTDCDK